MSADRVFLSVSMRAPGFVGCDNVCVVSVCCRFVGPLCWLAFVVDGCVDGYTHSLYLQSSTLRTPFPAAAVVSVVFVLACVRACGWKNSLPFNPSRLQGLPSHCGDKTLGIRVKGRLMHTALLKGSTGPCFSVRVAV